MRWCKILQILLQWEYDHMSLPDLKARPFLVRSCYLQQVISWCITKHAIHNATSQQLRHILKNIKWHRRLKASCIGNWAKPNVSKHVAFPFQCDCHWCSGMPVCQFSERGRGNIIAKMCLSHFAKNQCFFQQQRRKPCLQRTSTWTESPDPLG